MESSFSSIHRVSFIRPMDGKMIRLLLTGFLIFLSTAVLALPVTVMESDGLTLLDQGWIYAIAGEGGAPEWRSLDLPSQPEIHSKDYVEILMSCSFIPPEDIAGKRIYIFLGRRWAAVEVFINGIEIVSHGGFAPDFYYHDALSINAPIPEGVLRYGQPNTLLLRQNFEYDRVNLVPPALGFEREYRYFDTLVNFMNVDLYRYLFFLSLFVALFYFMQFSVRPVERNNLTFAIVNIGLTIYFIRMGYLVTGLPFNLFYGFSKAIFFPAFTLMTAFVVNYLEADRVRRALPVFWIISIVSFVSILVFGKTNLKIDSIFSISLIPLAVEIVLMGIMTVRAYRRGVPDTFPMLFGVILGGLIGGHDIVFMVMRVYPHFWVQGVGIFVFDMGLFASLAVRSMRLHDELEQYSEKIEQKVFDRTRELQKANSDLKDAIEAARHASQAKSRFLANISHEMRTPLNCIIGFSEMLSRGCSAKQLKNVDVILEESERLLTLINQLLDIEKIEAGKIALDTAPFSLKDFLQSITKSFALQCAEKGLEWKTDMAADVPVTVEADSFRLRQVLDNLVSNAVKFTSRGSVLLTVTVESLLNDRELVLRFTVHDSGIGIPPDQSDRIFESFEQGDSSRTRVYGGSGLGMTITKQLVGLMKGSISFSSKVGTGTSFWFTLPCSIPVFNGFTPSPLIEGDSQYKVEGSPSVLIVEDYPSNRVIARTHLESLGCRVVEVENGRQAVDLVESRDFDLILMDIQMPEMDGIEATTQIRRSLGTGGPPILGLTANAFPEDLAQYRQAGMNGVLTKPLRRDAFLAEVAAWLSGKGEQKYPAVSGVADESIVCDFNSLLKEVDNQRDEALSMLRGFSESLNEQIPQIKAAFASGDWDRLHREIHSIKGGGLNVFAFRLSSIAEVAESEAKSRRPEPLKNLLPVLYEKITELRDFIRELDQPVNNPGKY